jgi:hypothetical protein
VKVGPVGFGIFAFADASIKLEAYVGPGQLRDTKVQATIDLDKPEEATVHGQAQFYVPAYAGLRLDVGGGVKAQVAVAYVKGRVGLYGTLGLLVEGSFDVGVDWNPTDGFAVGAEAKIVASPKFELGVTASITAGVDLGLFDIDKTWGPWEKDARRVRPEYAARRLLPDEMVGEGGARFRHRRHQDPEADHRRQGDHEGRLRHAGVGAAAAEVPSGNRLPAKRFSPCGGVVGRQR